MTGASTVDEFNPHWRVIVEQFYELLLAAVNEPFL
jgi:hypothetical protein